MRNGSLSFFDVIRDNLSENGSQLLREAEKRLGQLSEASELMLTSLADGEGPIDPASLLLEASLLADTPLEGAAIPKAPLPENRALLSFLGRELRAFDRVGFTECFLSALEGRLGRPLTLCDFPEGVRKKPREERVLYVKNAHADLALHGFASLLPLARPLARPSFRAVCDDLEGEIGDYAILPLFSGGKEIPGVFSLLLEYGFSIAALIRPPTEEEEPPVFALLARNPLFLSEPRLFSLRLFPKTGEDTTALLFALDRVGLAIREIETLPTATLPGYRLTVEGEEKKFVFLLTYLTLFLKDFSTFGFYSEVKKGKRSL